VNLEKAPLGSAAFFVECEKITAIQRAKEEPEPRLGTLGGLMAHYFSHDHFTNLSPATQRDYRWCARFVEPMSDLPVNRLDTPMISGIHNKAAEKHGWRRGNYVLTFLSQVFKYAIPDGLIATNPALGAIPKEKPRNTAYANRPWTLEEERTLLAQASPALRAALALMANTGLDPSDAIRLQRTAISGDTIYGLRGKTQVKVVCR
jgi:integrase